MPDWREDDPEYTSPFEYDKDDEHPVAKLYRRQYNAECMRLAVIDRMLGTLSHADTQVQLFTFAERREWGLRVNARRTVE